MQIAAVSGFRCLNCNSGALRADTLTSSAGALPDGSIVCGGCGKRYAVRKGVPRFVPDSDYAGSFGFQWNKFRRTQLDSHTKLPLSRDRVFLVTRWQDNLAGQTVLEAGSGAGRFTEVLLRTGASVYSFDISDAVDANFENNGHASNLHLFQASIYDIPLPRASFDKVLCLGVLQHTPDPERSFRELVSFLRPGGEIAIDIYARSWQALLNWKYVLRPITKRMSKRRLLGMVEMMVTMFLRPAILARKLGGAAGARLFPILQYSHWGLPLQINREWAILDTFDMYSPAYDYPRSIEQVTRWFESAGLEDVHVGHGPNGVIARGRVPQLRPASPPAARRSPA